MASPTAPSLYAWRLAPWASRLLVACFVVAMVVPGMATLAGLDREVQRDEDQAALQPGLIGRAAWFDGHFAFRAPLVRAQAWLRFRLTGASTLATVWRGRDDWRDHADDGAVEETLNRSLLSPEELDAWCETLQHTSDWLHAQGIAYVFVVAPGQENDLYSGVSCRPGCTRTAAAPVSIR